MTDSKIRIPGLIDKEKQRLKTEKLRSAETERALQAVIDKISGNTLDDDFIKRWTSPDPYHKYDTGPDFSHMFEARRLAKQKEQKAARKKPATRESELHRFIACVFLALCRELGREPTSKQVFRAIEERHHEFDTDDIIQEVTASAISWVSSHGNEQKMKLSTLQNIVSRIRTKK